MLSKYFSRLLKLLLQIKYLGLSIFLSKYFIALFIYSIVSLTNWSDFSKPSKESLLSILSENLSCLTQIETTLFDLMILRYLLLKKRSLFLITNSFNKSSRQSKKYFSDSKFPSRKKKLFAFVKSKGEYRENLPKLLFSK